MSKLNNLRTNIQSILPNDYYKNGKWLDKNTNEFTLEFDCVKNVFDYYGDLAFLDGKLARDVIDSGKLDFDSPSAHFIKNWITQEVLPTTAEVLHKFTTNISITDHPAVLKFYAKKGKLEKCTWDSSQFMDAAVGKPIYTALYANGYTAEIDWWSYDANEELVVHQAQNCSIISTKMIW